jgi:uncharacterized protein (TIGR00730 family)
LIFSYESHYLLRVYQKAFDKTVQESRILFLLTENIFSFWVKKCKREVCVKKKRVKMTEFLAMPEYTPDRNDAWRVFRMISELVLGFDTFNGKGPFISIFGSSRIKKSSPYYHVAYDVSSKIAQKGFSIITGAGPGAMEAANKAAKDNKRGSAGLIPDLPNETPNSYLDSQLTVRFQYFFIRKVMFIRYAQGFVFLPGGYGTLDELFEVLTLLQTKKIQSVPVFLIGTEYWKNLSTWIMTKMLTEEHISKEEAAIFTVTDDTELVANALLEAYVSRAKIPGLPTTL